MDITTIEQLEEVVGLPGDRAAAKERATLTDIDRAWLAASPFCVLATADAQGRCDASPKGDPPGQLAHVIDESTIALAERPGNKRVDSYRNVIANSNVGLDFIIPGRADTLRINGAARLVADAPFFDAMAVRDRRPILALVVDIETIYFHCGKALMRSRLWEPETWDPTSVVPRRAVISQVLEPQPGKTLEELDDYYRPENYAKGLY
ncbi:MAG: Pyridoxamine 5-phosphate oxidase [Nocardioides sp.]|jgi:PPOX class probable FMN-dependent enzyme|uniref:MSMEG_1061 family FMN-dependent PPOX-type flavoprotein n=1 Tax=Nocardioides sp. TaxID=35761 RepID=UPI002620533E|nr:MSMEG_1061 family FMN-dependent PPOX-type flavoprotein [Nocardioides sp.]MCW2834196.1 Pyridoxamine 5-phosphate oxidase [Nocardioides sp.]